MQFYYISSHEFSLPTIWNVDCPLTSSLFLPFWCVHTTPKLPFAERKREEVTWAFSAHVLASWLCHPLSFSNSQTSQAQQIPRLKILNERANQAQLCLSPDTGTRKWKVYVLVQTHSLPFHNCGQILPTCAACRHAFSSFHFNGEEKLQEP